MSNRLDKDREAELEPKRLDYAFCKLRDLGFDPCHDGKKITFLFKQHPVTFFPYSGWASGKSIKDGRGLNNLLKQLK